MEQKSMTGSRCGGGRTQNNQDTRECVLGDSKDDMELSMAGSRSGRRKSLQHFPGSIHHTFGNNSTQQSSENGKVVV